MMDVLTVKDIAVIATPFLVFFLGVAVAAVGFLVRSLILDLKQDITEAKNKAEQIKNDFMEFKAEMPRRFVYKDDYIRTIASFEYKLDSLGGKIDKLSNTKGDDGESRIQGAKRADT